MVEEISQEPDTYHLDILKAPTLEMARQRIQTRAPQAKTLALDEIDELKRGKEELVRELLNEKRTVLVTMSLGKEDAEEIYRRLAAEHNVPLHLVPMVSHDTEQGLLRRLKYWVNEVRRTTARDWPRLRDQIMAVDLEEGVYKEIGRITAFRPWEVNSFIRAFLLSQLSDHSFFTARQIRDFFDKEQFPKSDFTKNVIGGLSLYPGLGGSHLYNLDIICEEKAMRRAVRRVIEGNPLDRAYGERIMARLLEKTGLGFVTSNETEFGIKGEWLKRDWEAFLPTVLSKKEVS